MKISSRYSDYPDVDISVENVPEEFRHLVSYAVEWCISDDEELDAYIEAKSEEDKRDFVEAFSKHFEGLANWHQECRGVIPQPHELVMFDDAAHAAATVLVSLDS